MNLLGFAVDCTTWDIAIAIIIPRTVVVILIISARRSGAGYTDLVEVGGVIVGP